MQNVLQCATDSAAAMIGKLQGFIALIKKKILGLNATCCVIHWQHLVARNLSAELHHLLHIVIKCINKIKANFLNDRLFHTLFHNNEEDFRTSFITYCSMMAFYRCFYDLLLLPVQFTNRFSIG